MTKAEQARILAARPRRGPRWPGVAAWGHARAAATGSPMGGAARPLISRN
jgi:hypothetical protein